MQGVGKGVKLEAIVKDEPLIKAEPGRDEGAI